MAINSAFNPQGNTFLVTTNSSINTASAQVVSFSPGTQTTAQGSGLSVCPSNVRVVNTGSAVVYVSFTTATRTAVVPTASVPSLEFPMLAGLERVFTLPQPANAGSATPYTLQINTISGTASQNLLVTFGEGQ